MQKRGFQSVRDMDEKCDNLHTLSVYYLLPIFHLFLTEEEQIGKPAPTDIRRASESETSVAEDSQVSCNNLPGCGTALCSELNMRSHFLLLISIAAWKSWLRYHNDNCLSLDQCFEKSMFLACLMTCCFFDCGLNLVACTIFQVWVTMHVEPSMLNLVCVANQ